MLGYVYDYMAVTKQENLADRTQSGPMTVDASGEVDGSAGLSAFSLEKTLGYDNLNFSIMTNTKWFKLNKKATSIKCNQFTRCKENRRSERKKYHRYGTHTTNLKSADNILNLFVKKTQMDNQASQENGR